MHLYPQSRCHQESFIPQSLDDLHVVLSTIAINPTPSLVCTLSLLAPTFYPQTLHHYGHCYQIAGPKSLNPWSTPLVHRSVPSSIQQHMPCKTPFLPSPCVPLPFTVKFSFLVLVSFRRTHDFFHIPVHFLTQVRALLCKLLGWLKLNRHRVFSSSPMPMFELYDILKSRIRVITVFETFRVTLLVVCGPD